MFGTLTTRLSLAAVRKCGGASQRRGLAVVSGPPTNHISKAEEYILGTIMCSSLLVIPAWVLVHIKEYRAPK